MIESYAFYAMMTGLAGEETPRRASRAAYGRVVDRFLDSGDNYRYLPHRIDSLSGDRFSDMAAKLDGAAKEKHLMEAREIFAELGGPRAAGAEGYYLLGMALSHMALAGLDTTPGGNAWEKLGLNEAHIKTLARRNANEALKDAFESLPRLAVMARKFPGRVDLHARIGVWINRHNELNQGASIYDTLKRPRHLFDSGVLYKAFRDRAPASFINTLCAMLTISPEAKRDAFNRLHTDARKNEVFNILSAADTPFIKITRQLAGTDAANWTGGKSFNGFTAPRCNYTVS